MLLPTLVRWLSRWVSYLLFSIISKIPKTKVDIVPGTCTGHEAVSPLGGAESGHPGQHPGSQSWVVYLYFSMSIYSIDSCNITDLLHCCGSPVSRPSCHWSNSAAVPTAASTGHRGPATARLLQLNWRHNRGTAQYLRHTKIYFQQAYFQMLDIL